VTQRDDDAAWQQIVDNYGEPPSVPSEPAGDAVDATPEARPDLPEPFHLELYDEEFVPPPLPPPPVISPERRLAWVGLVGCPVLLASVSSRDTTEVVLGNSYHVATLDHDAPQIFERSVAWIRERTPATEPGRTTP